MARYSPLWRDSAEVRPGTSMTSQPPYQSGSRNAALWIVAALLAIIAVGVWIRPAEPLLPTAWAQSSGQAGARGVYAFTGQIDHNRFGLFMLDVDQGTIWCYGLERTDGVLKLRLLAGRTWIYDRYLQDFNVAPPDFREIQQIVARQRGQDRGTDTPEPTGAGESPPRGNDER